ncbi:hypothetical protein BDC45DRAFT_86701 [Circinella umbellata]|nr:hypothetical protein BDC45DRAFT_86701 [Circinella umbellata]
MQDVSIDEKHQQDEYSTSAYTIDNNSSNDMDADMIADTNAAAIEPFFIPQQSTNSEVRRSSAASTDSGFQSSPADDDNEKKLDDDFYYYEQPLQNINTTTPPLLIDPLLALRPGSGLSSPSSNTTFTTFTSNSNDEFYSNNNQLIVDSIESSSSSSSTASSSINENTTIAATTITSIYNTEIKTENTGFMNGEIIIPDSQVQLWAKEHDQCTTRIIRLRSQAETFKPSFGHVSLVEPKGISIISDIDDTIKDTQILAGPRTVLSNTFFKQSRDVPGMADAYAHWYTQGAAFHYVSNSPFQLMPMLDQFLKSNAFPPGSMHLRVDGKLLARLIEVPGRAKRDAILQIIKDFPHRQFVLIGDSGEIDLEIYGHIAAEYPDRILKIFIRDVSSNKKKDEVQQQQQQQLGRSNTISAMTSLFTPNTSKNNNEQRPPNSINSNDASSRRAATLGDMASISSVSLQSRVAKVKQLCSVDIVIFQDAETLRNDSIIRDALWNSLDEQS